MEQAALLKKPQPPLLPPQSIPHVPNPNHASTSYKCPPPSSPSSSHLINFIHYIHTFYHQMAKLLFLVAALAAVLLMAEATSIRTTVVVNEREESCDSELREQQYMRSCQQLFMRQSRGRRDAMEDDPSFRICCSEMRQMSEHCRCQNLEQAIRQGQQQGQLQRQEAEMAMQMAENLPSRCGMQSPDRCDFGSRYLF